MNAPIRAAARVLAMNDAMAKGMQGQEMGDHVEATWEAHIPNVCAVLDAVTQNIHWKRDEFARLCLAARVWAARETGLPLPVDDKLLAGSCVAMLYAIRDEGAR